ncbi:mucin-12 isoform X2 [Nerophis ophidion]|uniref:mucin-12 isoform X2 n=1 Tax=Nerophis ophidion TaxID=159077 RepID=UPI002AE09AB7|nr:mucin-12 isoform X2 [Nerophis ophidion]
MDSESLDHCIQTALASLFPPFQATSPTVLGQVLSVVESCYRGDGVRYLIHFLLPAKHFLQRLQHDACSQFGGLLFRHEGWPLCLHEKIVVQLSPLDRHLLRPGDFYLQLSPPAQAAVSSPRLQVCSVSDGGHHVVRQEVPALSPRSVFSMAWLDSVNRDREQRGTPRLERCLLSAQGDVFRVPWEDVVHPQFIHRPRAAPALAGEEFSNRSRDPPGQRVELQMDQSAASSEGEESEGEYVELTELQLPRFSPQKGSLTQSISLQHQARRSTRTHTTNTDTHSPTSDHTHKRNAIRDHKHTTNTDTHSPTSDHTHKRNAIRDHKHTTDTTTHSPTSDHTHKHDATTDHKYTTDRTTHSPTSDDTHKRNATSDHKHTTDTTTHSPTSDDTHKCNATSDHKHTTDTTTHSPTSDDTHKRNAISDHKHTTDTTAQSSTSDHTHKRNAISDHKNTTVTDTHSPTSDHTHKHDATTDHKHTTDTTTHSPTSDHTHKHDATTDHKHTTDTTTHSPTSDDTHKCNTTSDHKHKRNTTSDHKHTTDTTTHSPTSDDTHKRNATSDHKHTTVTDTHSPTSDHTHKRNATSDHKHTTDTTTHCSTSDHTHKHDATTDHKHTTDTDTHSPTSDHTHKRDAASDHTHKHNARSDRTHTADTNTHTLARDFTHTAIVGHTNTHSHTSDQANTHTAESGPRNKHTPYTAPMSQKNTHSPTSDHTNAHIVDTHVVTSGHTNTHIDTNDHTNTPSPTSDHTYTHTATSGRTHTADTNKPIGTSDHTNTHIADTNKHSSTNDHANTHTATSDQTYTNTATSGRTHTADTHKGIGTSDHTNTHTATSGRTHTADTNTHINTNDHTNTHIADTNKNIATSDHANTATCGRTHIADTNTHLNTNDRTNTPSPISDHTYTHTATSGHTHTADTNKHIVTSAHTNTHTATSGRIHTADTNKHIAASDHTNTHTADTNKHIAASDHAKTHSATSGRTHIADTNTHINTNDHTNTHTATSGRSHTADTNKHVAASDHANTNTATSGCTQIADTNTHMNTNDHTNTLSPISDHTYTHTATSGRTHIADANKHIAASDHTNTHTATSGRTHIADTNTHNTNDHTNTHTATSGRSHTADTNKHVAASDHANTHTATSDHTYTNTATSGCTQIADTNTHMNTNDHTNTLSPISDPTYTHTATSGRTRIADANKHIAASDHTNTHTATSGRTHIADTNTHINTNDHTNTHTATSGRSHTADTNKHVAASDHANTHTATSDHTYTNTATSGCTQIADTNTHMNTNDHTNTLSPISDHTNTHTATSGRTRIADANKHIAASDHTNTHTATSGRTHIADTNKHITASDHTNTPSLTSEHTYTNTAMGDHTNAHYSTGGHTNTHTPTTDRTNAASPPSDHTCINTHYSSGDHTHAAKSGHKHTADTNKCIAASDHTHSSSLPGVQASSCQSQDATPNRHPNTDAPTERRGEGREAEAQMSVDAGKEEREECFVAAGKEEEKVPEREERQDGDGAVMVELEEEVELIIVQHNQEGKQEVKGGEQDEARTASGSMFSPEETLDEHITGQPVPAKDSYSEKLTEHIPAKDSCCEKTEQTHAKENITEPTHTEHSYSEKNIPHMYPKHSYCEKPTEHIITGGSYSEKLPEPPHNEDSDSCAEHTNVDGSYSEIRSSPIAEGVATGDSYTEKPQRSCCEGLPKHTQSEDSYSEDATLVSNLSTSQTVSMTTAPVSPQPQQHREEVVEGINGFLSTHSSPAKPQETSDLSVPDESAVPTSHIKVSQTSESSHSSGSSSLVGFSESSSYSCRSFQSGFSRLLLKSGVVCLPGSRSRGGRALVTVSAGDAVWSKPECDGFELFRLLRYYTSTLSDGVLALSLTVLVDARKAAPAPALFSALRCMQEDVPGSVHTVLLLVNKDTSLQVDKAAGPQVEVLNSLKALQKHVDLHQLPVQFGGSFSFSHSSWLTFRLRVEQLTNQCKNVICLLQKNINIMEATALPAAAEEAEQLLSTYKDMMCTILQDRQLVQLQQEGGASLSRLRRDEAGVGVTKDYVAAVDAVSRLYEQVDELLHRLVTLSNSRIQELHFIVDFKGLEEGFAEVSSWMEEVGEVQLKSLSQSEDSLDALSQKQLDFKDFYSSAYDRCKQGQVLLSRLEHWGHVSSADLHVYAVKVRAFWAQLQDFSQRVNATGRNIDKAVRFYRFLDQAYGWAIKGRHRLAGITVDKSMLPEQCRAAIGALEEYRHQHPPIPEAQFQEMKALAGELGDERGVRQWNFAWSKCQEAKSMFDRKMAEALSAQESAQMRHSDSADNISPTSTETVSSETASSPPQEDSSPSSAPASPQHTPLLKRLFGSEASFNRPRLNSSACHTPSFSFSSRRQLLRKTHSFDCPATPEATRYYCPSPRTLSEPARRGNTGVFIRGLEVSSTEATDRTLCPRTPAPGWGSRNPGTPGRLRGSETQPAGSKLRHIVEEMVTTEREYVRSLRYIIQHYFPEMDRADLPQDLRGKRFVVFGNLEKLLDFHSQFFLKELEACWKHPLRVSQCFLRHQEQFSLYALYSKNKPKSDALLANHGLAFFKRKQLQLADKMDLSSYLLKPIQRMSKYALLLTDLIKEVGATQEAELHSLQSATAMVKFQLRHGNDLLAMDAICNCDVNLKEQGQLIRQDEFTVWSGRRKSLRRVFLFEELLLLSKAKKMEGGLDVFIYKQSFKTADLGLTESAGDNGLRFEIWFRRRTTKNQALTLQAAAAEVKHAWTGDITRILWTQATRNKEVRLKEMVSMGVGNKPFLDIQPSAAAISDRAVHYITKTRGARTRASIAVSVFDHANPFKRAAVTSDPSSSSLLGSLNLHVFRYDAPGGEQATAAASSSFGSSTSSSATGDASFVAPCVEEDEQETASQPSMTTESSGSSSRCLSGSTGSDSGCVSSNLHEALHEEPSAASSCSSHKRVPPGAASVIGPATMV